MEGPAPHRQARTAACHRHAYAEYVPKFADGADGQRYLCRPGVTGAGTAAPLKWGQSPSLSVDSFLSWWALRCRLP